jgi:pimeloyl-ACP methyl ester carboxylesterase
VRARFLASSRALDHHIATADRRLQVPTLLVLAERDRIIDNEATAALVRGVCARPPQILTYGGANHSIQFDFTDRLVADMDRFVGECTC